MKTIEVNLYKFSELSEEAQQKVIEKFYDINVDYDWWEYDYEDAENIGLILTGFDLDRGSYCKGHFKWDALECANAIITNHGETCETYKTALEFLKNRDGLVSKYSDKVNTEVVAEDNEYDFDQECDELEAEFLKDMLNAYKSILRDEYEYRVSREAIIETIEANDYDFTEAGELY